MGSIRKWFPKPKTVDTIDGISEKPVPKSHGMWFAFKNNRVVRRVRKLFKNHNKTDSNEESIESNASPSYPSTQPFDPNDLTMARFGQQRVEKTKWEYIQTKTGFKMVPKAPEVLFDKFHPILRGLDKRVDKKMHPLIVELSSIFATNALVLGRYLGGGTFGIVLAAKMKGKDVVVKLDTSDYFDMSSVVNRMSQMNHKNLVKVFKLNVNPPNMMVMEIGECDLWDFTVGKGKPLTPKQTQQFSRDIINGMNYLHTQGWAHNDLKNENIVVCKSKNNQLMAKVVDFDFMDNIYSDSEKKVLVRGSAKHFSPLYCSPEVHLGSIIDDMRKPDIYAIGVTIYVMANLYFPYPYIHYDSKERIDKKLEIQFKTYDSGDMFTNVPNLPNNSQTEGLLRVLKRLLNPYVDQRETLDVILKDKYFKTKFKQ